MTWWRLTKEPNHDYIIRNVKGFCDSNLGKELGINYNILMRSPYGRAYWRAGWSTVIKYPRNNDGWKLIEIKIGDFVFFDLKKDLCIDLNEIRKNHKVKILANKKATKIRKRKTKKKVRGVMGNWGKLFDL